AANQIHAPGRCLDLGRALRILYPRRRKIHRRGDQISRYQVRSALRKTPRHLKRHRIPELASCFTAETRRRREIKGGNTTGRECAPCWLEYHYHVPRP